MRGMRTLALVVLAACGDNIQVAPDAAVPDAPPMPDAALCAGNQMLCEGECIDVSNDEANCGDCGNQCRGGEVCTNSCACPTDFLPQSVSPSGFDQFQDAMLFTIAISPNFALNGINPVIFGFDPAGAIDTDIDLATIPLGQAPFVAIGVGFDLGSMTLDTQYLATAGTIRFTTLCATEIQGTLTDVTFNGVTGGLGGGIPMVDPAGCVVTAPSIDFHVASEPCQ
jgi:hypothetical protein